MKRSLILFLTLLATSIAYAGTNYGKLIFHDAFERTESQELKDEPGNGWTTSSDKMAGGHKQVDLVDGTLRMWFHETANHATSTRHEFAFEDGTIGMKFMLPSEGDSLKLNFADMNLKTVWAGHLFNADIHLNKVTFEDLKTGVMDLKIRDARRGDGLSAEQTAKLTTKKKSVANKIEAGEWHDLLVHVDGDKVAVVINGNEVGSFRSEGFAHPTKGLLRLLVPGDAYIDDIKIWRRR